jgi:predicted enzyme related to lactoylglutathione lyase
MEEWMARISYVELPAKRVGEARDFYAKAFGWAFTDFGPD